MQRPYKKRTCNIKIFPDQPLSSYHKQHHRHPLHWASRNNPRLWYMQVCVPWQKVFLEDCQDIASHPPSRELPASYMPLCLLADLHQETIHDLSFLENPGLFYSDQTE